MRALLALLLLAPGLAWGARTAFQVRCEDTISKARVLLTSRQGGYSIDNTRSWRALTAMKGQDAGRSYVLGLTRTEPRVAIGIDGPMLQDRASGNECVAPKVSVQLYYIPIVIFVSREFVPGSCAYQEILAHEMRHLNTYLDHLPKVETKVLAALKRRFDDKPLYAPAGQAKLLLEREIDGVWMPYIRKEMAKVELLQAAIDAPKEYARLSKVCKGEVQSIIGPARRTRRSQ
jgi:hypothetical protein